MGLFDFLGGGGPPRPTGAQRIAATGKVPVVKGFSRAQVLNFRTDVLANFSQKRADDALADIRKVLTPEQFDAIFPNFNEDGKPKPPPLPPPAPGRPDPEKPVPTITPSPPPTPADPKVIQARKRQRVRSSSTKRRATIVTSRRGLLTPAKTDKKSLLGS